MSAGRRDALEQQKDAMEAHAEACVVRLARARFGFPVRSILEIVGAIHPNPVPLAPEFVGGLVHYRGDVLTTVSLRKLLGLPACEASQAVLVIEGEGGCFGVQVDAVDEVLRLTTSDFEPNPSTIDTRLKVLFAGAYKLRDGLLVMLEPGRLDPVHLRATHAVPSVRKAD